MKFPAENRNRLETASWHLTPNGTASRSAYFTSRPPSLSSSPRSPSSSPAFPTSQARPSKRARHPAPRRLTRSGRRDGPQATAGPPAEVGRLLSALVSRGGAWVRRAAAAMRSRLARRAGAPRQARRHKTRRGGRRPHRSGRRRPQAQEPAVGGARPLPTAAAKYPALPGGRRPRARRREGRHAGIRRQPRHRESLGGARRPRQEQDPRRRGQQGRRASNLMMSEVCALGVL